MKYIKTASRLKKAMADNEMNAATLEKRSGVGKSSISHYVNGTHKPSNITADAMAEVLNVNPLWLMGFDVSEDRKDFIVSSKNQELTLTIEKLSDSSWERLLEYAKFLKMMEDKEGKA